MHDNSFLGGISFNRVIIAIVTAMALLSPLVLPVTVYADNSSGNAKASTISPNFDHYSYEWQITSVGPQYDVQSGWHFGASGVGPAPLSFSQSIGVGNSYNGSLQVSYQQASAAVGWTLSATYPSKATYEISIPSGKTYEIAWAGVYRHIEITQTYMESFDYSPWTSTGQTANIDASAFEGFAYTQLDITNTGPQY